MSIRDKLSGIKLAKDLMKAQKKGEDNKAKGGGDECIDPMAINPEQLSMLAGSMLSNLFKAVPLEKYKRIKEKNPDAKILPMMKYEEIQTEEGKEFLRLVNVFTGMFDSIPEDIIGVIFKISFDLVYQLDTREDLREDYNKKMINAVGWRIIDKSKIN